MSCSNFGNKLNIVIQQGATFTQTLNLKGSDGSNIVDIANAELRGQIRTGYDAAAVTAAFTFTWTDHNNGVAEMTIDADDTKDIPYLAAGYVYDVELYWASGIVWRVLEGKVKVTQEVTK